MIIVLAKLVSYDNNKNFHKFEDHRLLKSESEQITDNTKRDFKNSSQFIAFKSKV